MSNVPYIRGLGGFCGQGKLKSAGVTSFIESPLYRVSQNRNSLVFRNITQRKKIFNDFYNAITD